MKRIFIGKLLIISLFATQVVFGQEYLNDKRTLMTVGDDKVSVAEFMRVYQKNNVQGEVIDKKSVDEYLELYIKFKLKVKEAEDLGMDTVKSFVDELAGYRTQLTKPYFIDEQVNEELLKEAYERKLTDIRAGHILIRIDENASPEDTLEAYNKIAEIRNKAINGLSFEDLAVEFSEDPSAKDMTDPQSGKIVRKGNKGDLGYFTVFDMVYPFENGAYNSSKDDISEIVRTRFGYHIIKITDKKEAMGNARVAHIFLRIPETENNTDSAVIHDKINNAYKELEDGVDFAEVVLKYSDDNGTKEKGGELPPFGSNRMVPEFIYEISLLDEADEYSEPFQTSYGWHIVKLIERNKPGTFEEEKEELKTRLARDSRSHKSKDAVIQKIKVDFKLKEYPANRDALFTMIDSTLLEGEWNAELTSTMTKPVFKLGKVKYSQYDFGQYIGTKQKKDKAKNLTSWLTKAYDEYLDETCINYLDKRLEVIYPDFGLLMKEYRDGILLFELTDDKVWTKAVNDSAGLQEYYNNHDNKYMWGERVNATFYTISGMEKYMEIKQAIVSGLKEDELTAKFNTDSTTLVIFTTGNYSETDNPWIDEMEWKSGTTKVIDKNDGKIVIYINEVIKPQPKTLDEARGLVIADYQGQLEEEWIDSLRKKYPVDINDKTLMSIKETY